MRDAKLVRVLLVTRSRPRIRPRIAIDWQDGGTAGTLWISPQQADLLYEQLKEAREGVGAWEAKRTRTGSNGQSTLPGEQTIVDRNGAVEEHALPPEVSAEPKTEWPWPECASPAGSCSSEPPESSPGTPADGPALPSSASPPSAEPQAVAAGSL